MPIYLSSPGSGPPGGILSRILAAIVAAVLLVLFVVFGFAIFLVLLVVAIVGGIIFSWRFRKVRREMESMMQEAAGASAPFPGTEDAKPRGKNKPADTEFSQGETLEGEYKVIDKER
ncbi:MAG: hypothetical protein L3J24_12340 [Xanthomonadales bacterium]|nr:hypothetical protein [Xanthomonadales bacterium]